MNEYQNNGNPEKAEEKAGPAGVGGEPNQSWEERDPNQTTVPGWENETSAGRSSDQGTSENSQQTGWVYGGTGAAYQENSSYNGGQDSRAASDNWYTSGNTGKTQQPGGYQSYGYQGNYSSPYQEYRGEETQNGARQRVNTNPYQYHFEDYEAAARSGKGTRKNKGVVAFVSILCVVLVFGGLFFTGVGIYQVVTKDEVQILPDNGTQLQPGKESSQNINGGLYLQDKPSTLEGSESDGSLTTAQIQKKVRPSVVGVVKYQGTDSFTASGEGSGIIMSADGYIVTNAHVVSGADEVGVFLSNGEDYVAQIIGIDSKTDLAVLKIDAQNLSYAEFGNSDQLEVGEKAVAIGYPGGIEFGGSTTEGIISGLNRVVKSSDGNSMTYIQTDAAINPGNSGGALINRFGQVIGINSAKVTNVNYEGIGFAIPINEAKPIIDELKTNGRVTGRVKIGITVQPVTEALSKLNDVPQGVRIVSIEQDSDAAAKNLMVGDIIIKINDKEIYQNSDVSEALEGLKPGQAIKMTIYRKTGIGSQKTFEVNVTLQEDIETVQSDMVPTSIE